MAPIGWPRAMAPPFTLTLLRSSFEVADELLGHDGEGLVDLEQVDVVDRQAGLGEHLLRGRGHRGVEHERGVVAHVGDGDERAPEASTRGRLA